MEQVRAWFPGARYELFALVFIHLFQLTEILAFTAPVVAAFEAKCAITVWAITTQAVTVYATTRLCAVARNTRQPNLIKKKKKKSGSLEDH